MENFQMTEGKFLATGNYLKQEEINENTLLLNYKTLLARYLSQGELCAIIIQQLTSI